MVLLIICIASASYCDYRGGYATSMVNEAQCRTALAERTVQGLCINPDGTILLRTIPAER